MSGLDEPEVVLDVRAGLDEKDLQRRVRRREPSCGYAGSSSGWERPRQHALAQWPPQQDSPPAKMMSYSSSEGDAMVLWESWASRTTEVCAAALLEDAFYSTPSVISHHDGDARCHRAA